MKQAVVFRLLNEEDKAASLESNTDALRYGSAPSQVYLADVDSFRLIPGSPFAYWTSPRLRATFASHLHLGSAGTVRQGLATADNFRFLRAWWEVETSSLLSGEINTTQEQFRKLTYRIRWVPFAKGGTYSPYYADLSLVLNWHRDGEDLKAWAQQYDNSTSWSRRIVSTDLYYLPGLTWPLRTQGGLSVRALPAGCIFGHKGPVVFASNADLPVLLALTNSSPFRLLVSLQMAFGSYEVGVLQRTPIPSFADKGTELGNIALRCVALKQSVDMAEETSHGFVRPALVQVIGSRLSRRAETWNQYLVEIDDKLAAYQRQIDDMIYALYGIETEDRLDFEASKTALELATAGDSGTDDEGDGRAELQSIDLVVDVLSYAIGGSFGRWDVRLATGERPVPELPDPFAPLPVCSPGMLSGEDGLPLWQAPPGYPLSIDEDGILPDDPDHSEDIMRRVHAVLDLLWRDSAEAVEGEACNLLGVKSLRDYFRNPAKGFFDAHIKKYSKSRRKAPIYWLLQSPRKLYGLWIYYHRLDGDLLFKALTNYVEPKIARERNRLGDLRAERSAAGSGGAAAKSVERAIDRQEVLLADLHEFRDRLAAAAHLGIEPDLNDGVLLTIAPLREVVPWKEARTAWDELVSGKYGWSSIGQQMQAKGLVKSSARGAHT